MTTLFEQFANDIGVGVRVDKSGLYTGLTKALYNMAVDVVLSDDEKVRSRDWIEQQSIIKERFFEAFPYAR